MIFKKWNKSNLDGVGKAAVMGTNFVAHTIVGLVLGYYTDKWFDTAPWGLLFWLLMGIIAAFRGIYRDAMQVSRTQSLEESPDGHAVPGTDAGKTGTGDGDGKAR